MNPTTPVSQSLDSQSAVDLSHTVAFLLAGGQGTRLHELTQNECKPALHFGGAHRIVDFTMANAVTSGLRRMLVATQFQPGTLSRHLNAVWLPAFPGAGLVLRDGRQVAGPDGYGGTADAVRANIAALDAMDAREVVVLAGDHIYQMDYRPLIAAHRASSAQMTLAALPVPVAEAGGFGIVTANADGLIARFSEKPAQPEPMPGDAAQTLASMGIYVVTWRWLRALLLRDPTMTDFGHDVVPVAVAEGVAGVHVWRGPRGTLPYWRDVGTLDAYRMAALDFAGRDAPCDRPLVPQVTTRIPPDVAVSRSRFAAELRTGGMRILTPLLRARDPARWAVLDRSVLMPGVRVSPGVRLTNCIVAPGTVLPDGLVVGEAAAEDRRWFRVTEGGTTLITTAMIVRRAARRSTVFSRRHSAAQMFGSAV